MTTSIVTLALSLALSINSETGPNGVATWGTATVDRADGFGFKWSRTGQSSKHIPFDWTGPGR